MATQAWHTKEAGTRLKIEGWQMENTKGGQWWRHDGMDRGCHAGDEGLRPCCKRRACMP